LFAGKGCLLCCGSGGGVCGSEGDEIGDKRGDEIAAGQGDRQRNAGEGGIGVDGRPEIENIGERVEEFAFGGTRFGGVGQYLSIGRVGEVTLHPFAELNGTRQYGRLEGVERGGVELLGIGGGNRRIDGVDDIGAVCSELGDGIAASEGEGRGSECGIDACPTGDEVLHGGRIGTDTGDRHLRCPPETVELSDEGRYLTD